jgi:hypothetical protein
MRYQWERPEGTGHPARLYGAEEFHADEAALVSRHDRLRVRIVAELEGFGVEL